MNIITIIVLATLIIELLLHIFADYLNIKMLNDKLPEEFHGYYDEESYKKSQAYLKTNTKFGWIVSLFSLAVILVFWFSEGFQFVDSIVRSFYYGPIVTGIIYIGILLIMKTIISLSFSIYSTFVIEEKYGFNKTTVKLFITDMVKSLIIGTIIGVPFLAGILLFFEYTGENAWLYCWTAAAIFMMIIQYIFPTWIMPLFNKFEPVEEGELRESIFNYARSIDFSLKNIYVMDGSKRSSKSNAFFTGFGKSRRIVLFDTLIEKHTVQELVAVLAHEMGHFKKKHILKAIIIGIIQMGIMFFILSFFLSYRGLFDAFYMENISVYAGLIFFGMLYAPLGFFLEIAMQIFSRRNEYEADQFAVETTGKGGPMIDALKKLSVHNLSNLLPHPLYVFLNYSHPPVLERIKAIRGGE